MNFKFWFLYRAWRQKIWLRVVAIACLSVLSAVLAQVLSPYVPTLVAIKTGSDSVSQILAILASSMLAVTTFSLSIAVTGFGTAAGTATPRATALLQEDTTTQNVLATFIGAFLFSLLGLIALNAQLYDKSGQVVLYLFTMAVVLLVVVALIRWTGHLMSFGRMDDTLDRVETAAINALHNRLENPYLGGCRLEGPIPDACIEIPAAVTGYVEHVDLAILQAVAEDLKGEVYLDQIPGSFVVERGPLVHIRTDGISDEDIARLQSAFAIGKQRVFDEDPRFGLIVLSEIASRALSPAVNDPGTAISVLGRLVRILASWRERADLEPDYALVHVCPVKPAEAIEDAFRPIARDGAGMIEVQIRLQKALLALRQSVPEAFEAQALELARYALGRAREAALPDRELALLDTLAHSGETGKQTEAPASV
jgi:uncharacterized membrane protein